MSLTNNYRPLHSFYISFLILFAFSILHGGGTDNRFGVVDENTVALWLFDETPYPKTILADASRYEHDLRLVRTNKGAKPLHIDADVGLLIGKFGRALYTPPGGGAKVEWPSRLQRYGNVYLLDRGDEVPERLNLGYLDWTIELWFQTEGSQLQRGSIFEIRNDQVGTAPQMINALILGTGRSQFLLSSKMLTKYEFDVEIAIPTDTVKLNDSEWHHLAFTYTASERQIHHYVDGKLQELPGKGGFLPTMNRLVSLQIAHEVNALVDEMRISDMVRYSGEFTPPESFSRNYGPSPPPIYKANGPPLLFNPENENEGPIPLHSRKHLFIDDALIERMENVRFTPNSPVPVETDFRNTEAWEPTPRMGSTIPDVCSVWDEDGEMRMLYTNSGMWGARNHVVCFAKSKDGIHWEKPILGLKIWDRSTRNNIVLMNASQGAIIKDRNPQIPPEEKYKYIAWNMYWGFYVFTSPDGIHFRRNETCLLPFDPDGSNTTFWDDQAGVYRTYIRAPFGDGPTQRRNIARLVIPDLLKPWPFIQVENPHTDMLLSEPTSGELPIVDTGGQVYRFKAHKYAWAPDTYLAFPWRYLKEGNVRPGSFLMVSRDGVNWKRYENPYYFASGWELNGRKVIEALTEHGMIRRGDEIWQYGTVRYTEHGGVMYGGVEFEGGMHDRLMLLKQRLDGFVSLDAGHNPGEIVTKPLIFTGSQLQLNIKTEPKGSARIAILNQAGQPIPGYALEDCDPITTDDIRYRVTWNKNSDLTALAGEEIQLEIQLKNAKLYALQFMMDN